MKTFSIIETRQFHALPRKQVVHRCASAADAILTELVKLSYLNDTVDQPHWIDVLSGLINKNAVKVQGGEFDYSWFFEDRDTYDEDLVISYYDSLPSKYDGVKPVKSGAELDPNIFLNNLTKLRKLLVYENVKLNRLLTLDEIHQIVNQLEFYK